MENVGFDYECTDDISKHKTVFIGKMDVVCIHCNAKKFKKETHGFCCKNGKVKVPLIPEPPEPLKSLLNGLSDKSKIFLNNIRKYNCAFQMTSFRAKQIKPLSGWKGSFKVQGQIYHSLGPLLNTPGRDAQFVQIYFMDSSEMEVERRCEVIPNLDKEVVASIQKMLHEKNCLITNFKIALESEGWNDSAKVVIRADKCPQKEHERRFNAPTSKDVAIIMSNQTAGKRDIVVKLKSNNPKDIMRINEGHRKYDAFQYPLMFWNGQDSYDQNEKGEISRKNKNRTKQEKEPCSTSNDWYKFMIQDREGDFNLPIRCKELYQQFCVDMFAKVDSERLLFHKLNQKQLRASSYKKVAMAIDGDLPNIGKPVILAASYTGGPRYMHKKTLDAMAYVRTFGKPSLFITFTCNPKWTEITDHLLPGQVATDRPDIIDRVFKLKAAALKDLLLKDKIFGPYSAYLHTIEFQKRGLPHVHILLWLEKTLLPSDIDRIISAELPNQKEDPELYKVITTCNIHGPCGKDNNKDCQCMVDGKCSKKYPKPFQNQTICSDEGFPEYRRRKPADGLPPITVKRGGTEYPIDNSWVVAYNALLSKTFGGHVNVEVSNITNNIQSKVKILERPIWTAK